jgi:hypothetical protein
MRRLIFIASLVSLSVASVAEASTPGPFIGCYNGAPRQSSHGLKTRPSKCGWWPYRGATYNSGNFRSIHWHTWGSQSATASAVAYGTHTGTTYANRVTIRLGRPVTCYGLYRLFTRMKVTSKYGTGVMAPMRCSDIEDQE